MRRPHPIACLWLCLALGCGATHTSDGDAGAGDVGPVGVDAGFNACASSVECIVAPRTCCGRCGVATSSDLVGLATTQAGGYRMSVCAGMACPACAGQPDPYLVATCVSGACQARDLHAAVLTTCDVDSDCTLAAPTCCACGVFGMTQAIAYAPSRGSLSATICDPGAACPPCVLTFPGLAARCSTGRCVVVPSP